MYTYLWFICSKAWNVVGLPRHFIGSIHYTAALDEVYDDDEVLQLGVPGWTPWVRTPRALVSK